MQPIKDKILASIQPVIANSSYVTLDQEALLRLASSVKGIPVPDWNNELQLKADLAQTAQYYFFLDSINFCFWPPKGGEKWHFEKDGEWLSGYYAYSYAIKKAFESDNRFYDARFVADISLEEFSSVFTGRGQLQLLNQRWQIVKENFRILAERFDGQAINLVEQADKDVNRFIELLLENFPSFRDQVEVDRQQVYFLKRAQILPSDMCFAMNDPSLFTNLKDLSVYADYKLPQLLQAEGVFHYSDELLAVIKSEELIEPGSPMEVEIRAWTIYACDLLTKELERLGRPITSNELDWILWVQAKQTNFALPHHKTLTTYY